MTASNVPVDLIVYRQVGDGFVVEVGAVIRLWCDGCRKATLIDDAGNATVDGAKQTHRHGPRSSRWESGGGE